MNYFSISHFNGLGLLQQNITRIKETDLTTKTKTFEELLNERKRDNNRNEVEIVKLEHPPNGKVETPFEIFLDSITNLSEETANSFDKTKYNDITKKIGIVENAIRMLDNSYQETYADFTEKVNTMDKDNLSQIMELYAKYQTMCAYQEFVERMNALEVVKPI